jgi:hypothetical protein
MKKLLFILLTLTGCGTKEKATESLIEKAIESGSGQKVDLGNIMENSEKQSASGQLDYNGKPIISEDVKFNGSIQIIKNADGISIGATYGSDVKSMMMSISNIKEGFSLPIVAQFNHKTEGQPKATLAIIGGEEGANMFNTPMPFDGTLTITELSSDQVIFEIYAKGADAGQAENSSAWKPFRGKFTMKSPVVISVGVEKEKVLK